MQSPKVFIIVLHYKNWKDTNECLKSLEKLDYPSTDSTSSLQAGSGQVPNFEIIVIDNDKENPGFAGGMNIGIRQALEKGADYVLLLNNDTIVEPDFLKELVKVGESDKKNGILGPVIYDYQSKKIHFAGGKINWLYTKGIHLTEIFNLQFSIFNPVDYVTGACLLIKREVIEKIGLMDEDYFLYFEDVDWCLKASRAGYKCVLVPNSKIWHKVSSSAVEESFSYIYYHTRNGLLLAKKNAPFFIKILAYLWSFWIYKKQIIKFVTMPLKRKWAKAIMKGIGDFYRGKTGRLNNFQL